MKPYDVYGPSDIVKYGAIMFAEIAACPEHRLDPSHWLGGHRIEECHKDLKAKVEAKRRELYAVYQDAILTAHEQMNRDLQSYIMQVREQGK